jgi:hypothetical protein
MPKTGQRPDEELWALVDYDPVCVALIRMRDTVVETYPAQIGTLAAELVNMVMNETYDRLEGKGNGMRRVQEARSRSLSRNNQG